MAAVLGWPAMAMAEHLMAAAVDSLAMAAAAWILAAVDFLAMAAEGFLAMTAADGDRTLEMSLYSAWFQNAGAAAVAAIVASTAAVAAAVEAAAAVDTAVDAAGAAAALEVRHFARLELMQVWAPHMLRI
jgi:hypothetical protein